MTKRRGRIKGSHNGVHAIKRDRAEAERLFTENMGLVTYVASHMDIKITDDVLQDGYIGLWKAALWYDDTKNTKFATYAVHSIRNNIIVALRSSARSVQADLSLNQPVFRNGEDKRQMEMNEVVEDEKAAATLRDVEFASYLDSALTETEKTLVEMRVAGSAYAAIGKRFDRSDMWAIQRVRSIKEKLEKEYAERMIKIG